MAGLGVDKVSVFFLAEGEQPADEVMARLTTFIRAAKQTLDFAIYDMRFSDPLKASLSSALRERAEAGVKIRFCYDADKPFPPNVAAWSGPGPIRHRRICAIARLSVAPHRRNETDA
jgi:phosphatidylserine/phosphatidylglycerophosphate/cardiolipin synthase-like enzyme